MDEDLLQEEAAAVSAKTSRQPSSGSKASRSQRTSAKSRPVSGGSSLNTEIPDPELMDVMKGRQPDKEDATDASEYP